LALLSDGSSDYSFSRRCIQQERKCCNYIDDKLYDFIKNLQSEIGPIRNEMLSHKGDLTKVKELKVDDVYKELIGLITPFMIRFYNSAQKSWN